PTMKAREPVHSTKASLVSWVTEILTLSSWSRSPQDCRFMALIRLCIPSTGAVDSETSHPFFRLSPWDARLLATARSLLTPVAAARRFQPFRTSGANALLAGLQTYERVFLNAVRRSNLRWNQHI